MSKRIHKKTWKEFSQSGMLWWINRILQTFGWSIVIEFSCGDSSEEQDDGCVAYPARVKFRGFTEQDEEEGYRRVSDYMAVNAYQIREEIEDE